MKKNKILKLTSYVFFIAILFVVCDKVTYANELNQNNPFSLDFSINSGDGSEGVVNSLQMLFIFTIIALAPSILIMMTAFTRIVVVLHFLRSALGTQQVPPNQVLVGLALFLTLFIMGPTFTQVNEQAFKPYSAGSISQEVAIEKAMSPMREFMFRQVRSDDLALFTKIAKVEYVGMEGNNYPSAEELPSRVLIPAFIISELKTAFIIGFLIYIPFIVIDMVVASTLMSMGMMMLPPVMISLPFKILLFILVDGWNLIIGELVKTFQ